MTFDTIMLLYIGAAVGFMVLLFVLPRWGPHYISRLICPNCKKVFNFHWIPGVTISSIIYRGMRPLRCPYCHIKSTYDINSTRVIKQKVKRSQQKPAVTPSQSK